MGARPRAPARPVLIDGQRKYIRVRVARLAARVRSLAREEKTMRTIRSTALALLLVGLLVGSSGCILLLFKGKGDDSSKSGTATSQQEDEDEKKKEQQR